MHPSLESTSLAEATEFPVGFEPPVQALDSYASIVEYILEHLFLLYCPFLLSWVAPPALRPGDRASLMNPIMGPGRS